MPTPKTSEYPLTIASGAAQTIGIDVRGEPIAGVRMPPGWTAADVAFDESPNGTDWYPLYNDLGEIRRIVTPATYPGVYTAIITPIEITCARYVRVKSISRSDASAVNQGADRALTLITRDA